MEVQDITLLGSGIACTITLIEVLDRLLNNPPADKIKISVAERSGEFWKGIPYGARSSVNALTITSVLDFTNESERPAFFAWLKENKNTWAAYCREHGGITAARWLDQNLPLIDDGQWDAVYTPRFLYGNYMAEKLDRLRKIAEEKGLIEVTEITAEAIDINVMTDGLHEVVLEHKGGNTSTILTKKLVLSTGSAPVKTMHHPADGNVLYINDIYEPSAKENFKALQVLLERTTAAESRNVLLIGSNASSIELLYLLEGMPALRQLINKVVVVSTSGMLPYHISTEVLPTHPIPHLDELKTDGNYDIKTLCDAAAKEIKSAMVNGANMDYVATIVSTTLKMMEPLGEHAKKEFYCNYGLKLRDMFRRSGPDYKYGSQVLIDLQQATLLKGRFIGTNPDSAGSTFNYQDVETGETKTYPLTFNVIINCTGSHDLDRSSSRLLYNLVHKKIAVMNMSGKGFEVNERFEAAPNLYVMGPLLGGNVNKLIHFWQLENASRLTYLAPYLVTELLGS